MKAVVRYAIIDADHVFNLTSPRFLPEISLNWRGKKPWHDLRYEPVRSLMERMYVDGFNDASGHFRHLERSLREEGFRNPIMVSAGHLERRAMGELPPDIRGRRPLLVSEYLGGSRLWVAQREAMKVPCIVNDYTGELPGTIALEGVDEVLSKFTDRPRSVSRNRWGGIVLNDLPYVHLPEAKRYDLATQSKIRREIIDGIKIAVADWLREHD